MFAKSNSKVFLFYILVIGVVFGNCLFNGFVYDDGYLIVKNPFIKDFSHLKKILLSDVTVSSSLGKASGYYRPAAMVFFMMVYKLWGLNPAGWHLTSLVLHFLNTFFVFLILKRLTHKPLASMIGGLVFAIHPVHVEAVAPAYNLMGLLATCLGLGSWLMFMEADLFKKRFFLFLSVVLFAAGVFAKEELLVLPGVLVLYDFFFWARRNPKEVLSRVRGYMPFLAVMLCYLVLRGFVVEKAAAFGLWNLNLGFNVEPSSGLFWQAMTTAKVFALYLVLLVFPFSLSAFHVVSAVCPSGVLHDLPALLLAVLVVFYAFYSIRRRPLISFFLFMFLIGFLPVSNLIPIGGLFAERLIYFPSLAYGALFGLAAEAWMSRYRAPSFSSRRRSVVLILSAVILLYGFQTAQRNYVWRNNVVLWQDTLAKAPESPLVRLNLAGAYFENGLFPQALEQYRTVLKMTDFKKALVHNAVGKILGMQGKYAAALKEFGPAIRVNPGLTEAYYNAGITYFNQGKGKDARSYFQKAIQLDPDYAWSYYGMGLLARKRGDTREAERLFKRALFLNPRLTAASRAVEEMRRSGLNRP